MNARQLIDARRAARKIQALACEIDRMCGDEVGVSVGATTAHQGATRVLVELEFIDGEKNTSAEEAS